MTKQDVKEQKKVPKKETDESKENEVTAVSSSAPNMAPLKCDKAKSRGVKVPGLAPGEAWGNLTKEGKYRCTVCSIEDHPRVPYKKYKP